MRKRTRLYSLWLGIGAGLVFSLSLWAYEAILFIGAHVAYPWISLVVGTILCVLVTTSAALLTHLGNRAILGVVFWVTVACLIAEIAIALPLKFAPALMKLFEPGLQSKLPIYPITATFKTWAGFGMVWLAIFFAILGLLQLTLVEQAVPAGTAAGRLVPYFVFVPIVALASMMSSNQINSQLRVPFLGTNTLIQFAVDNQNVAVDPLLARQMHLSSVNTISELIGRPYRLFLGQYDPSYWQVGVLIDFDGEWATCTAVNGQAVFCKPIDNP
ncbi:MAG: hypothetical protein ABIF04_05375 [Chloroflexota bacterium]